jgi:hypothetical protein
LAAARRAVKRALGESKHLGDYTFLRKTMQKGFKTK